MRFRLPLFLLLSPLTVACYDDAVEPTVSDDTSISVTAAERPRCEMHGGYLAIVGESRAFGGTVHTTTSTCTCEYTQNHGALGCRTDAFCESSYDIGGENPETCTNEDSNPEVEEIGATASREDCAVTTKAGAPGTFTGTLTCASEGPVTVRVVVTTAEIPRAAYIDFSVLAVDAPCQDGDDGR